MKPSEIKLEEFNNCPGKYTINHALLELNINHVTKVVDLDPETSTNWENDPATLVIMLNDHVSKTKIALALGQIAVDYSVDELHWKQIGKKYVVRLWWD